MKVAIVGGANKWPAFPPPHVRNLCTLTSEHFGWSSDTRFLGFVPAESFFALAAVELSWGRHSSPIVCAGSIASWHW